MLSPNLLRQLTQGPLLVLLTPVFLYFALQQYARSHYYRDPTSPYFDVSRAYSRVYSTVRSEQADAFVNITAIEPFTRSKKAAGSPLLCVGMLTVARPNGVVYFRTSLASLVAGLTQEERDQLYIMPFITHTDPSRHPAFGEPWLEHVADRVLGYDKAAPNYQHILELEAERDRTGQPDREKHMSDYTYLMRMCTKTDASYILMMEDDVLALDGWFHRAKAALKEVERKTRLKGVKDFFYLRLFYTEKLLTWESDEKRNFLQKAWLAGTLALTTAVFTLLRKNPMVRKHIFILFAATYLSVAIYVIYFFHNGHHSMLPIRNGVNEMPRSGCCAQGIIYPRTKVELLTKHYEDARIGFVDTLAEELGDKRPDLTGARWALTPSPMQHIGGKSSKGDNWGSDKPGEMSEAEKLWNFAFELNDEKALRKEHEHEAKKKGSWKLD